MSDLVGNQNAGFLTTRLFYMPDTLQLTEEEIQMLITIWHGPFPLLAIQYRQGLPGQEEEFESHVRVFVDDVRFGMVQVVPKVPPVGGATLKLRHIRIWPEIH